MIFLDTDGVLVDFKGTAAKFGIELAPDDFTTWKWCDRAACVNSANCPDDPDSKFCEHVSPEEFYEVAELQPWANNLFIPLIEYTCCIVVMTANYSQIKENFLLEKIFPPKKWISNVVEAPDKSVYCTRPTDLLIDDNAAECEAWRKKGGIAYHFDLAHSDPFGEFLKYWRLEK